MRRRCCCARRKRQRRTSPTDGGGEFNAVARAEIEDKKYRTAYSLASQTGLTSGKEFAEAEFLAGWIGLRFLGEAKTARTHFERLESAVTRPISRSRAHYWEGRADEALGDAAAAWRQYREAADSPDTFYGQLALARIEASPVLHLRDTDPGAADHPARITRTATSSAQSRFSPISARKVSSVSSSSMR